MIIYFHQQYRGHALLNGGVVTEGLAKGVAGDGSGDVEQLDCSVDNPPGLDARNGLPPFRFDANTNSESSRR